MSKYSILVIDDENEICELMKRILFLEGYDQVELCTDSEVALERIKNNKYHIVISDIVMPRIDGVELLKKVKEIDPLAQVIMMTGHSTLDKTLRCLELGANDYILKPFKSNEYILEIVEYSIKKLERWKDSIKALVK